MLSVPAGIRIWLVAGVTDMRRGLDGLSALVQTLLSADVLSGQLFIFRGRRSDRVKIIWRDVDGLCLFYKRLDRAKFTWTHAADGAVLLTPAQLSALLEGIDWRRVHRTVSTEEPVGAESRETAAAVHGGCDRPVRYENLASQGSSV